jgi:hypothetical protein
VLCSEEIHCSDVGHIRTDLLQATEAGHHPLDKGDHPKLDTSGLLEVDDIKIYELLIGTLQCVIQTGRFDIMMPVMTLFRF